MLLKVNCAGVRMMLTIPLIISLVSVIVAIGGAIAATRYARLLRALYDRRQHRAVHTVYLTAGETFKIEADTHVGNIFKEGDVFVVKNDSLMQIAAKSRNALVKFGEGTEIFVQPRIPGESMEQFRKRCAASYAVLRSGRM